MTSYDTYEDASSSEEFHELMTQKAHELFSLCDVEKKGFITKRDMQRLQAELPLTPEQLESVFDSLDDDANGYLTLEEFTGGFGSFLGAPSPAETSEAEPQAGVNNNLIKDRVFHLGDGGEDDLEEEDHFNFMIDTVGAQGLFDDVDVVKKLWQRLRNDEPELLTSFEQFILRVTREIKQRHSDFQTLEMALRNKGSAHDEEVRRLYDEMEQQIKIEKERVLNEEKAKERLLREEMERELYEKDKQLQDLLSKHHEMQERLTTLNQQESETKQSNEKLLQEREELEELLHQSQRGLDDSKSYINQLRSQHKDEKKERALAALKISEGIALERESLVKQLDMLREMNKRLRDDKDESQMRTMSSLYSEMSGEMGEGDMDANEGPHDDPSGRHYKQQEPARSMDLTAQDKRKNLIKRGSIMSNYFSSSDMGPNQFVILEDDDEDYECDDYESGHSASTHVTNSTDGDGGSRRYALPPGDRALKFGSSTLREQPVGANSTAEMRDGVHLDLSKATPTRLFKVVFVGDSGVGKSSFIHRFCSDKFKPAFSTTIGVDFQVKNLVVDGHVVALQLWDTAGQERFRSITKQYFRKADGVLVFYDVTCETTFTNVRNWMDSVKDGVEEGSVIALIGNKMDLTTDDQKAVKTKDGTKLSEAYDALFYETSAMSGYNVIETMMGLARLLREKEDQALEKSLNLTEEDLKPQKKKGCCN